MNQDQAKAEELKKQQTEVSVAGHLRTSAHAREGPVGNSSTPGLSRRPTRRCSASGTRNWSASCRPQ